MDHAKNSEPLVPHRAHLVNASVQASGVSDWRVRDGKRRINFCITRNDVRHDTPLFGYRNKSSGSRIKAFGLTETAGRSICAAAAFSSWRRSPFALQESINQVEIVNLLTAGIVGVVFQSYLEMEATVALLRSTLGLEGLGI